ncbi:hypothetical protein BLOT_003031 [Blomia tropicalis]|nr:hypothetical protein BLOT_003031 [Blomia tropicalis]
MHTNRGLFIKRLGALRLYNASRSIPNDTKSKSTKQEMASSIETPDTKYKGSNSVWCLIGLIRLLVFEISASSLIHNTTTT